MSSGATVLIGVIGAGDDSIDGIFGAGGMVGASVGITGGVAGVGIVPVGVFSKFILGFGEPACLPVRAFWTSATI